MPQVNNRKKLVPFLIGAEILIVVLLGLFGRYDAEQAKPNTANKQYLKDFYPTANQLGFLMTFLRRYGYSAVGLNMLISALWDSLICFTLIWSDFAAGAVMISFGAVLGITSPLQLAVMGLVEVIPYALNEYICIKILKASDMGGSMIIHTFGAFLGLGVSFILNLKKPVGYLSLAACCVTTFALSSLLITHNKFEMIHIQNSTLAGGVAIGTSADLLVHPFGAVIVGMLAGTLSVVGYQFVTPFVTLTLKLNDTCGVINLHGFPGILGAAVGALLSGLATFDDYGKSLYVPFPAREEGRSAGMQVLFQLLALLITIIIALVSGMISGLHLRIPFFDPLKEDQYFEDEDVWEIPEDTPVGRQEETKKARSWWKWWFGKEPPKEEPKKPKESKKPKEESKKPKEETKKPKEPKKSDSKEDVTESDSD